MQFRRYIAGVDQHDPEQRDRLGDALGALIDEVATSKQDFLVKAAERDGFIFADGVFRPAATGPSSFEVTRVEDLASIDDRGRRLHLLANDSPRTRSAELRSWSNLFAGPSCAFSASPLRRKTADIVDIAKSTLKALDQEPLSAVVAGFGKWKGRSPRHARLAARAAVAFAAFIAETYLERAAPKNG